MIDVEITIGAGRYDRFLNVLHRVVHLTLREGDDMRRVTKNFCKTYSINEATRTKLEN